MVMEQMMAAKDPETSPDAPAGFKGWLRGVWARFDLIDRQLVKVAGAVLVILILRPFLPPAVDMPAGAWILALALILARPLARLIRRGGPGGPG
ncbi:hypothetical protein PJ900_24320 [Tistrella mobilis]|uniref:Uncharacterized protein n=1 Tax=Tistrella mobilis TaxID=171437 RepID=A0A161Q831_9PROT|nr:hypothetical protein [Tistrella mobilis]KYO57399.1 hypothetical protein AUP44_02440 [Tistrella mobilis]